MLLIIDGENGDFYLVEIIINIVVYGKFKYLFFINKRKFWGWSEIVLYVNIL